MANLFIVGFFLYSLMGIVGQNYVYDVETYAYEWCQIAYRYSLYPPCLHGEFIAPLLILIDWLIDWLEFVLRAGIYLQYNWSTTRYSQTDKQTSSFTLLYNGSHLVHFIKQIKTKTIHFCKFRSRKSMKVYMKTSPK